MNFPWVNRLPIEAKQRPFCQLAIYRALGHGLLWGNKVLHAATSKIPPTWKGGGNFLLWRYKQGPRHFTQPLPLNHSTRGFACHLCWLLQSHNIIAHSSIVKLLLVVGCCVWKASKLHLSWRDKAFSHTFCQILLLKPFSGLLFLFEAPLSVDYLVFANNFGTKVQIPFLPVISSHKGLC